MVGLSRKGRSGPTGRRRTRVSAGSWGFWLAAVAAAFASLLTFDPKIYINGDNAEYMRMAERVLAGDLWPSSKYPPLFPYLLAPLQAIFGRSILPAKILVFVCYAGAALLLVPLFRRRLSGATGSILFFAALTVIPVLEFSHYVMSEVPFLLTLAAALAVADRWLSKERSAAGVGWLPGLVGALRNPDAWLLSFALAAGFYIRTAGVAVGAAIVLVFLLEKRWSDVAALLLLLLLFAVPWLVHSFTTPGGNPYFRQFLLVNPYYPEFGTLDAGGLFLRVRYNAVEYFRQILPLSILPIPYRSTYSPFSVQQVLLPWPIAMALVGLLFGGILRGMWRKDVVAWSVLASLLLVLLWPPIWAGNRFLVPLVPLCFLLIAQGAHALAEIPVLRRSLRASLRRGAAFALVAFLLLVSVVSIAKYGAETKQYPPEWKDYFDAVEWIRAHTAEDAIVIDRKAIFVEWIARRESRSFPREPDVEKMLDFLRESGAEYIVYPSLPYDDIQRFLVPAVASLSDYLTVEATFGEADEPTAFLFRFHPEGGQNVGR